MGEKATEDVGADGWKTWSRVDNILDVALNKSTVLCFVPIATYFSSMLNVAVVALAGSHP